MFFFDFFQFRERDHGPRNGFSCSSDPRLDFDRIVTVLHKICKCPRLQWQGCYFLVEWELQP